MKKIQILLIFALLIFSCTPDDILVIENIVVPEDIKIIELRADSDKMLANGEAIMEFRPVAYGIKEVTGLYNIVSGDTTTYLDTLRVDTFLIPPDRYPKKFIKLYREDGTILENYLFSTTDASPGTVRFYAKGGNIVSNTVDIGLRSPTVEIYDEIILPVIFHVIIPPSYAVPEIKITTEVLQNQLDKLNNVFNKKRTTNPNGGNAKITFKLAKYGQGGELLEEEGLNIINTSEKLNTSGVLDYMKDNLMWDPNKYLNIWMADISGGTSSSNGSSSFRVELPTVILTNADSILGITGVTASDVTDYSLSDVNELTDVGIVYNTSDFMKTYGLNYGESQTFDLTRIMGNYLGLYTVSFHEEVVNWVYNPDTGQWEPVTINNIVDGDFDYCPDTHSYDYAYSLYKKDYFTKNYFTTFNIMADYSRRNSISKNQAERIREVLESCPSRWSYKSNWAFTGQ